MMMKRALVGAAAVAATFGLAAPVSAARESGPPPGLKMDDFTYNCADGGTAEVYSGNGRSGWINGEKSTLDTIHVEYMGETVYDKDYGNGPSGETTTCSFDDGELLITFTAIKVQ